MIEAFARDVRFAVRTMWKRPTWAAAAVGTLALAIGATTSIFSIVAGVVIRPLEYRDPDQLAAVTFRPVDAAARASWQKWHEHVTTYPVYEEWRQRTQDVFAHLAAYNDRSFRVRLGEGTERVPGVLVTAALFPMLGVAPVLGRGFLPEEDVPGSAGAVVLSYGLWQDRFGGSAEALGTTIRIEGEPHTIVGVMPRRFEFPTSATHFWLPMARGTRSPRAWNYHLVGRLRSGISLEQADRALQARTVTTIGPGRTYREVAVTVSSLHSRVVGDVRFLLIFMGAVAAILLLASANVVNLMLTRATGREHEFVVRAALGARPARLGRQLVAEGLVISLLGAGLGLLLALFLTDVLVGLSPVSIPRQENISIDGGVLSFTVALAVVVGVGIAVVPAYCASRADLVRGLGYGTRGASAGLRHARLRDGLAVLQLALASTLLVCASLQVRSFVTLLDIEAGFDPRNVLSFETSLPDSRYPTFEEKRRFYDELLEGMRALPGVRSAAIAVYLPVSGWFHTASFQVEGTVPPPGEEPEAELKEVSPGYFSTMGIPLLEGRAFDEQLDRSASDVVVINESLARRYWPQGTAVGSRIRLEGEWVTVIGVASDVRYRGIDRELTQIYLPYAAGTYGGSMDAIVGVARRPAELVPSIRRLVATLDPEVAVFGLVPVEHRLASSVSEPRFRMVLLGAFGIASLLLAAVGVYGVMAYAVAQRTREMGIRKALGADQAQIVNHVAIRGLVLTSLGLGLGILGAFAITGVMQVYLFNLTARDPASFAMAAAVLGSVSMAACCIPALKAAKVDPMIALKTE
jgi:putative ABC transport system permease protein